MFFIQNTIKKRQINKNAIIQLKFKLTTTFSFINNILSIAKQTKKPLKPIKANK